MDLQSLSRSLSAHYGIGKEDNEETVETTVVEDSDNMSDEQIKEITEFSDNQDFEGELTGDDEVDDIVEDVEDDMADVESLECYIDLLSMTLNHGGISQEAAVFTQVGVESIFERHNLPTKRVNFSNESFDKSVRGTVNTQIAIENLEVAIEGIIGDVFSKIAEGFKKLKYRISEFFKLFKDDAKRLAKINKDALLGQGEVNFMGANCFMVNGKFDPIKTMNNIDSMYKTLLEKKAYLKPVNAILDGVEKLAMDYAKKEELSDDLIKSFFEEVAKEVAYDPGTPFKKVSEDTEKEFAKYEAALSDNVKAVVSSSTKTVVVKGRGIKLEMPKPTSTMVPSVDAKVFERVEKFFSTIEARSEQVSKDLIEVEKQVKERIDKLKAELNSIPEKFDPANSTYKKTAWGIFFKIIGLSAVVGIITSPIGGVIGGGLIFALFDSGKWATVWLLGSFLVSYFNYKLGKWSFKKSKQMTKPDGIREKLASQLDKAMVGLQSSILDYTNNAVTFYEDDLLGYARKLITYCELNPKAPKAQSETTE